MATTQYQVELHCECTHRRYGLISMILPWREPRPCRRCRRFMRKPVVTIVAPPAPAPAPQPQPIAQTIIYEQAQAPPPSYQSVACVTVK